MSITLTYQEVANLALLMPAELSGVASKMADQFAEKDPLLKSQPEDADSDEMTLALSVEENKALYKNYRRLEMTYAGLCIDRKSCDYVIKEAYCLAIFLNYIYCHLLQCSQDAAKYQADIAAFQALLSYQYAYLSDKPYSAVLQVHGVEPKAPLVHLTWWSLNYFRTALFINWYWFRLYLVRWNRFFTDLALLSNNPAIQLAAFVFDKIYNLLFLNILSFVFYVPRLLVNFFMIGKHVIPNSSMTPEEKALGWRLRLQIQWERRCFQIKNDGVWFATDLAVYFTVRSIGMMLIAALYAFDVLNTVMDFMVAYNIKRCIESRLHKRVMVNNMLRESVPEVYCQGIQDYSRQKMREKIFNISIATVLFIAMIPVMSVFSKIIPLLLVGATLLLMATTFQMVYQKKFNAKKPGIKSIVFANIQQVKKTPSKEWAQNNFPNYAS